MDDTEVEGSNLTRGASQPANLLILRGKEIVTCRLETGLLKRGGRKNPSSPAPYNFWLWDCTFRRNAETIAFCYEHGPLILSLEF